MDQNIKNIIFSEKVSKIIKEFEKRQKREEILMDFKVKREAFIKI